MLIAILFLSVGLAILVWGAELLVRGSASLARSFGIPALVVGLTIVAFGTSAPELIVNVFSAVRGSTDLAIGNIIGSNIANILLILGVAACIKPLVVRDSTVQKEIPMALLASVLLLVMGNDILFDNTTANVLTRTDGLALIAFFIIFMFYIFGLRNRAGNEQEEITHYPKSRALLYTIIGVLMLFAGGRLLVDQAVTLARLAGLSEALIGLTIVAIGTSLPEMATSVVAVRRGQNDIAVGNVVGSNIFNIFWILGLTSVIKPLPFNASIGYDAIVAVLATLVLFAAVFIGKRNEINKWQGIVFVLIYCSYISYLIIRG